MANTLVTLLYLLCTLCVEFFYWEKMIFLHVWSPTNELVLQMSALILSISFFLIMRKTPAGISKILRGIATVLILCLTLPGIMVVLEDWLLDNLKIDLFALTALFLHFEILCAFFLSVYSKRHRLNAQGGNNQDR